MTANMMNNAVSAPLPVVEHDGDRWRVLATGTTRPDGYTYCHLASTTRGRQQRNGWCPVQICDWIAADVLKAADIAILRKLGRKVRSGRATPEEEAAFDAADKRQMARQQASQAKRQIRGWWDLPVARACWEGDARARGGAA